MAPTIKQTQLIITTFYKVLQHFKRFDFIIQSLDFQKVKEKLLFKHRNI